MVVWLKRLGGVLKRLNKEGDPAFHGCFQARVMVDAPRALRAPRLWFAIIVRICRVTSFRGCRKCIAQVIAQRIC